MENGQSGGIPQEPRPEEGNPPRAERDPSRPTATGPSSVPGSRTGDPSHVGKDGPDASDPPTAAGKHEPGTGEPVGGEPDLDADEQADLGRSREDARDIKASRDKTPDDRA